MKSPNKLQMAVRPTGLLKLHHRLKYAQLAPLTARKFSATAQRPFLDVLLVQTHTLISGIHTTTGLPWAATLPLIAFLVRIVIVYPASIYATKVLAKQATLCPRIAEFKIAMEKQVQQEHRGKSAQDPLRIHNILVRRAWIRLLRQNGAQGWRTWIVHVNVPVWLAVMETIRRMTGTEDGMLSLAARSLTPFASTRNPAPGTLDPLIPADPALAAEGILWFHNLTLPDPHLILPFALSGITLAMVALGRGPAGLRAPPGSTVEAAARTESLSRRKMQMLKLGALALGPATLAFPSAMVLYWFSSSAAAIAVTYLPLIHSTRVVRSSGKDTPGGDGQKPKPKMQQFRGLTMRELRDQKRKKKGK